MQFQSDILDVPVERPIINETTALGAAYLAGLAVGMWDSKETISDNWKIDRSFESAMENDVRVPLYEGWKKAVSAARAFK
jgi:glycerol kinase